MWTRAGYLCPQIHVCPSVHVSSWARSVRSELVLNLSTLRVSVPVTCHQFRLLKTTLGLLHPYWLQQPPPPKHSSWATALWPHCTSCWLDSCQKYRAFFFKAFGGCAKFALQEMYNGCFPFFIALWFHSFVQIFADDNKHLSRATTNKGIHCNSLFWLQPDNMIFVVYGDPFCCCQKINLEDWWWDKKTPKSLFSI